METLSPPTQRLPARLAGFDLDAARERLGGNEPLLASLLQNFAFEHGKAAAEIDSLVAALRPAHAVAALHRLKGAARIIGATQLSEAAQSAEEGLLHGDCAGLEAFRTALRTTVEEIAAALREGPPR